MNWFEKSTPRALVGEPWRKVCCVDGLWREVADTVDQKGRQTTTSRLVYRLHTRNTVAGLVRMIPGHHGHCDITRRRFDVVAGAARAAATKPPRDSILHRKCVAWFKPFSSELARCLAPAPLSLKTRYSRNTPEAASAEVTECPFNLRPGVHDERPAHDHGLPYGWAAVCQDHARPVSVASHHLHH